jgi:uncharacterized membrane protein YfcA
LAPLSDIRVKEEGAVITLLTLFVVGLLAGVSGAVMGLGGGIFLVPLLKLFFDLPIRIAVGTSLVGVIATSAGVAAFSPRGRGADVPLALRLELVTTAAAIAGGLLAGLFPSHLLEIIFAFAVFFTAGYTFYKGRRQVKGPSEEALFYEEYVPRHWAMGLSGAGLAGMVSGLLGIGGGFIKVSTMYAVMDVPLGVATATSNFMVGITAAASVFVYYGRGDVYPAVVIPTAIGVLTGAMVSVYILPRLRAKWVRESLVAVLLWVGGYMLFEAFRH